MIWAALATASPALAGLDFCNDTGETATVAIGYEGQGGWTSEGWWTVGPDECTTAIGADLPRRYYYWRATTPDGAFATEDFYFCTSEQVFTIVGDTECSARGYAREAFTEVDVGNAVDYTVRLTPVDAPRPRGARKSAEPDGGEAAPEGVTSQTDDADSSANALSNATTDSTADTASGLKPNDIYDLVTLKAALEGVWRDAENRTMLMTLENDRVEDTMLGIPVTSGTWRLAQTCEGAEGDGPVMLMNYEEFPDETACWVIEAMTETQMRTRTVGNNAEGIFLKE